MRNTELNFTPTALFPAKPSAESDEKCVIISKVIQDFANNVDMTRITQEDLINEANYRYEELSSDRGQT